MRLKDLDSYICIKCGHQDLKIGHNKINDHEEIIDAEFSCGNCASIFPVKDNILRFVPLENYAGSFGYQWNLHKKTQLDSYTRLPISRTRLFNTTGWPEKMEGQSILEAGSGAGRFTEILCGTGAKIVSFDYSSAVEANFANNGHNENLNLFQGDIFNIPLRPAAFDKILCFGVLQHTPDPEGAFRSLCKYLKPGGEIVIDLYAKRLKLLFSWKYLLRPITRHLNKQFLYKIISKVVPILLPLSILLRGLMGRFGVRLLPIPEYSILGLPYELNKEWVILDAFDMYSPAHDHLQSLKTVRRWFEEAGLEDASVQYGSIGIVGKGKKLG